MEQWKPIANFERFYEVSNKGRIKSLDRIDTIGRSRKGRVLKQVRHTDGYLNVSLYGPNGTKTKYVHRLVAETFIPNPNGKLEVNHIDCDKTNNSISNLEWVTHEENIAHAHNNNLMTGGRDNNPNAKIVIDTFSGVFYNSTSEAARCTGINRGTLIKYLSGDKPNKTSLEYA